jgi:hypothetical protein
VRGTGEGENGEEGKQQSLDHREYPFDSGPAWTLPGTGTIETQAWASAGAKCSKRHFQTLCFRAHSALTGDTGVALA